MEGFQSINETSGRRRREDSARSTRIRSQSQSPRYDCNCISTLPSSIIIDRPDKVDGDSRCGLTKLKPD